MMLLLLLLLLIDDVMFMKYLCIVECMYICTYAKGAIRHKKN